jgi:hypothetical protein
MQKSQDQTLRSSTIDRVPLVHFGVASGSKAYRLYDPKARRIVVSTDVIFREKSEWMWGNRDVQNEGEPGMFSVEWGGVLDMGLGGINDSSSQDHSDPSGGESPGPDQSNANVPDENRTSEGPMSPGQNSATGPNLSPSNQYNDSSISTETEEQTENPSNFLRRSPRPHTIPKRLNDYVLLSYNEESDTVDNDEPRNFYEAKGKIK